MPLLVDLGDDRIYPGDIVRLPDNYDLGPGSGPVDLLVYDPRDDDCGYGMMVASGYKAGLILHVLPRDSTHRGGIGISVEWLIANWDRWFVHTYHKDKIAVEKAVVLRKDGRTLPQET